MRRRDQKLELSAAAVHSLEAANNFFGGGDVQLDFSHVHMAEVGTAAWRGDGVRIRHRVRRCGTIVLQAQVAEPLQETFLFVRSGVYAGSKLGNSEPELIFGESQVWRETVVSVVSDKFKFNSRSPIIGGHDAKGVARKNGSSVKSWNSVQSA